MDPVSGRREKYEGGSSGWGGMMVREVDDAGVEEDGGATGVK